MGNKVKNPRKRAYVIAVNAEAKGKGFWNSRFSENVYPSKECAELALKALEETGYFKNEGLAICEGPCLYKFNPEYKKREQKRWDEFVESRKNK